MTASERIGMALGIAGADALRVRRHHLRVYYCARPCLKRAFQIRVVASLDLADSAGFAAWIWLALGERITHVNHWVDDPSGIPTRPFR